MENSLDANVCISAVVNEETVEIVGANAMDDVRSTEKMVSKSKYDFYNHTSSINGLKPPSKLPDSVPEEHSPAV